MTIDEVLAREAIRGLQARYHYAGDRGRIDDLVQLFAPDGVLRFSGKEFCGRDAIHASMTATGRLPRLPEGAGPLFVHHHLTTTHVELTGAGEARGWCNFLVMSPVGLDHCGRYADRYVEADGAWLIAERTATVAWTAPDSIYRSREQPS